MNTAEIEDAILDSFVSFATELRFEDLPAPVVTAAKERLVDALGCAIGAHESPTVNVAQALAGPSARPDFAGRALGSPRMMSAEAAAFLNTAMIRTLDFNDTFPGIHPSDAIGGLLAVGATNGASGKELITAIVVAYEVSIRLQMTAQFRERGWDQGAAIGTASAVALANLLKVPTRVARHAIALAAVNNMPLRATRAGQLSMWKGAATAAAVRSSIFCMRLAQLGMTGPEAPFSGRHGLVEQVGVPLRLPPFGTNTEDFFLPRTKLKYWPVAYNMQLAVWAGIDLRKQIDAGDIRSIDVETYWQAWSESGSDAAKWDPRTQGTADHSLPYIMARALLHGDVDPAAFEAKAYLDPAIRPLMALITVRVAEDIQNSFPDTIRMRATARDQAGRTFHAEIVNPLGHESNPMSRDGIAEKFMRLSRPVLGDSGAEHALTTWFNIDHVPAIARAMDTLEIPASLEQRATLSAEAVT